MDAIPGTEVGTDTGTDTGTASGSADSTDSTDPSTGGGGACVPGQTLSCTCTGADVGVQVCLPDGSGYGPCECEGADATSSTGDTESTDTGGVCGDGVVDSGEDCDDGGESAACNVDCTAAACGDAQLNEAAGEQCDDGGESAACNADCTPAACGDGLVNAAAGEACDDGGETAACNVDCTVSTCGDGIFNASAGELCDEGGPTALCDDDCTLVDCGDGLVNPAAGEACDDAGESATCNLDCSLAACGDGITNLTAGEACDDAGESLSCNADCSPASCGDGITNLTAGEACDGAGDTASCNADCTLAACGDAYVNAAAGEACEGNDLGAATCQSLGFTAGTLACDPACAYDTAGCADPPGVLPVLELSVSPIKQFDFSWAAVAGADYYQLLESASPGDPFLPLGGDIVGTSISHTMPLHFRYEASYVLRACNAGGCTDSAVVDVVSSLAEAVGYFKASNTDLDDSFGISVALSGDGNTLAVGAFNEDSDATGIDGAQGNVMIGHNAGAVYVFVRDGAGGWTQQAYVKASNPDSNDHFGRRVALSDDGSTLAVGAQYEDSSATGIDGDQASNTEWSSGAVYVFARDGIGTWSQQAYVKASNTDASDSFGYSVALSGDGNTLAVGAYDEDSTATGINGDQANNGTASSGAAYVFVRDGMGTWSQQAYVKGSNTEGSDRFGYSVALSDDGDTLAVGAQAEASNATGVDGNQADDSVSYAGAVYVFVRDGMDTWSQQAYVKASNPEQDDSFGYHVTLSGDGDTLAVGAQYEDSSATGIDGDQASNAALNSGAVYVFVRDGMGTWSQQAYIKASNTDPGDVFGSGVSLSEDGSILAVGASSEDGNATGIDGNQASGAMANSGAVYVFVRDGMGTWSQQAYVKASNTGADDRFGFAVALSGDGSTLAVGAFREDATATGIDGDQASNTAPDAGAVYLY